MYISITIIVIIKYMHYIRCAHSIHFIIKFTFKIPFIHNMLFMVQDKHDLQSNTALEKLLDCWSASISPELMFLCLISLTSIILFQSKWPLFFNVSENNSFFLCLRYLNSFGAWKSLNWNSVIQSFFDQTNLHNIYTKSVYVVLA